MASKLAKPSKIEVKRLSMGDLIRRGLKFGRGGGHKKPAKTPKPMKRWRWESHETSAPTKSEARAYFKRLLELPAGGRLPKGANVIRVGLPRSGARAA
jgi:hypothetical protein